MTNEPGTEKYLDTLALYWEEEIEGAAYFAATAERLETADHREKMLLMADVEQYAADSILPLIGKYGLSPRSVAELSRSGRSGARTSTTDWGELIKAMSIRFPAYMDDFAALEAMAPATDLPYLKVLTAHETATIDFLNRELAGDPQSACPMKDYLRTGRA